MMTRVVGPAPRQAYADVMRDHSDDEVDREFALLGTDSDERIRQDLAARMLPGTRKLFAEHPDLATAHVDTPRGETYARKTIGTALSELYNPAQIR
ncbi:hypothetical protein [Streptomyces sp. cg35]|uniref:hypothetical protein n=1 Tax=Streptomyces sp. cg35 TaxID=3421650 RepID=UPI003D17AFE2